MPRKKTRVRVTNPKASAPLPKSLGKFATAPEQPGPIYPKQIRKSDQLKPSSRVRITGEASDLRML